MSYHEYYQQDQDDRNYDEQPTISVDDAISKYEDKYVDYLFDTEPKSHNEEWLLEKITDGESFYEWVTEQYGLIVVD